MPTNMMLKSITSVKQQLSLRSNVLESQEAFFTADAPSGDADAKCALLSLHEQ
jgi:hypothetical protein